MDVNAMLANILSLAVRATNLVGAALIVWGGVKFGLAIKDQQGGSAMSEALATMGGGAIIIAAGAVFAQLSW